MYESEIWLGVSESTALRYQQSDPDVRLMLHMRDDDASAFAELMRRYEARLVRLMHTIGPRHDMAEDLAQETVHAGLSGAKALRAGGEVFNLVVHNCRECRPQRGPVDRAAKRSERSRCAATARSTSGAQLLASTALEASALMPARVVEGEERAELVRAAVESLSERQRMALMLSRFENMSYAEIAETMDLSTKAVKSLLSRAHVNLKAILQPYIDAGMIPREAES